MKVAHLTHPFHCCAFEYPEQHDPNRHAQYEKKIREACRENEGLTTFDTGQIIHQSVRKKRSYEDTESWGDSLQ